MSINSFNRKRLKKALSLKKRLIKNQGINQNLSVEVVSKHIYTLDDK